MAVLCVSPSCKTIVRDGGARCEKHRTKPKKLQRDIVVHRKHKDQVFTGVNASVYNSARWKRLRNKKLVMSPYCEHCEDAKVPEVIAQVVDHIVEIRDNKKLTYSMGNLQSLCHQCHNTKTAVEQRKRNSPTTQSLCDL